jgi:hypothetical protein
MTIAYSGDVVMSGGTEDSPPDPVHCIPTGPRALHTKGDDRHDQHPQADQYRRLHHPSCLPYHRMTRKIRRERRPRART